MNSLLADPFIHWFIEIIASVTQWFVDWLIQWSIHRFKDSLIHRNLWLIHCFIHSLSHWCIESFIIGSLNHWFIVSLFHWLSDSLIYWFVDLLVYWFIQGAVRGFCQVISLYFIGATTTTCSVVDAPRNFITSLLVHLKVFPKSHWFLIVLFPKLPPLHGPSTDL